MPEQLWKTIVDGGASAELVAEFLRRGRARWEPGSWTAEISRVTAVEHELDESPGMRRKPEPLLIDHLSAVPLTERVDGIVSLRIPRPVPASTMVGALCEQVVRLRIGRFPEAGSLVRRELEICLLALLHARVLQTDHRLGIALHLTCPQGSDGSFSSHLHLAAELPLGGHATLFHTGLPAKETCAFPPQGATFAKRLTTVRDAEGMLRFER